MTAWAGSSAFSGAGSLAPTVFLGHVAAATFRGAGRLSTNITQQARFAVFTGAGSAYVTTTIRFLYLNQQPLSGSGRFCVQATVRKGRQGVISNVVEFGPGPSFNITVGGG